MIKMTRILMLMLATILLVGAGFLASREAIAGAIGLLVLATLAGVFERMLAVERERS